MQTLMAGAKLPRERCVLDALGWAQDAQGLAKLDWAGSIGYHFYSWCQPPAAPPLLLHAPIHRAGPSDPLSHAGHPHWGTGRRRCRWLPPNSTRQEFSALFQLQLRGISNRVYVTEFGGGLSSPNRDYEQLTTTSDPGCLPATTGCSPSAAACRWPT